MNTAKKPALVSRFLSYVTPYSMGFLIAIVGLVIVAATEPALAALMKPMLDGSFVNRDPEVITLVPLAMIGIFVVRGIGGVLSGYWMCWVSRNVVRDMRRQIFSHLLELPSSFYDKNPSGHLASKLIYDVEQVAGASSEAITIIVRDTLKIIGLFGWMLYLNWKLTMFFVVVAPLITFLVLLISKRFRKINRRIQRSMGNVSQTSNQAIRGYREIKVFGNEENEIHNFDKINELNRKQHMKMALTSASSVPVSQLLAAFALAGVLYVATNEVYVNPSSAGTFMSFITAAMLLLSPMKNLAKVTAKWQKGMAAAQSIFDLLDQDKERDTGVRTIDRAKGAIRFDQVTFSYSEDRQPALNNLSLNIQPGEAVAIVGKSGSGKSTLVNMIPRFYEPQSGAIYLDDISLGDIRLKNLRQHIAFVNQDIMLFNDTVGKNIAYGAVSDDVTQQDIIKAAEAAHAMEFIKELPEGLNTVIGDRGVLLSGGQRQRIAIARAILKDAPILILDEATSALDTESERLIQKALEQLMKNRTTLVIAHRLSTIEKADTIVVMSEGRIIEQGNHSGLLQSDGHYAALYRMQFREAVNA